MTNVVEIAQTLLLIAIYQAVHKDASLWERFLGVTLILVGSVVIRWAVQR